MRQAAEEHGKDRLIGGARRQVDLELGFELDDTGGNFDQAQPQGVESDEALNKRGCGPGPALLFRRECYSSSGSKARSTYA
jgi:hypothetical protein